MGNSQCGGCEACHCLNITTYTGEECTALLPSEYVYPVILAGISLFFILYDFMSDIYVCAPICPCKTRLAGATKKKSKYSDANNTLGKWIWIVVIIFNWCASFVGIGYIMASNITNFCQEEDTSDLTLYTITLILVIVQSLANLGRFIIVFWDHRLGEAFGCQDCRCESLWDTGFRAL